jgi:hypothetical protein
MQAELGLIMDAHGVSVEAVFGITASENTASKE